MLVRNLLDRLALLEAEAVTLSNTHNTQVPCHAKRLKKNDLGLIKLLLGGSRFKSSTLVKKYLSGP